MLLLIIVPFNNLLLAARERKKRAPREQCVSPQVKGYKNMDLDLQQLSQYASVFGFIIAVLGWLNEYRKRLHEKKMVKCSIWSTISVVKGIMNDVEKVIDEKTESDYCNKAQRGCIEAHGTLAALLRELFKEAIINEKKFSYQTILKWRASGKISSDWQQKLVMALLDAANISEKDLNEISGKYSNWDTLKKGHPCYSPHPEE